MSFDVRISGEHAKIVLSGDVDLQTTADLKSEIQNISGVARLEIEAGDVTYIDSSGVAVLLLARQHCAQNNIALSLPTISDAVFRVLQIAKLDVMLPIGQVLNSSDAGLMGLGSSEGAAPAADDELVNQLLAGDDDDDDLGAALAADIVSEGVSGPAGTDSGTGGSDDAASSGDFAGLDIGAADFETPSEGGDTAAAEDEDPVVDGGAMTPGTFS
ncbi:MAG: STAS domain-containing protein [Candidatus Puniceispirillaceae bacterium]